MKKQSKKLLSVILSIVLLLGLMQSAFLVSAENTPAPVSGDTYPTWEDAAVTAQENTDYTVDADTAVTTISTAKGLAWFAYTVNNDMVDYTGKTVTLMNNIDLSTAGVINYNGEIDPNTGKLVNIDMANSWIPIGGYVEYYDPENLSFVSELVAFEGTFDGNYNMVSGVYINFDSSGFADKLYYEQSMGLFGAISSTATIKNFSVTASHIEGECIVGGVVGNGPKDEDTGNTALINNVSYTGVVSGHQNVGGIVGIMHYTTVENCYNTGNITADVAPNSAVGGIAGYNGNNSTIVNCYNSGNITGIKGVGGITGDDRDLGTATVKNCYNKGEINGTSNVGGIIGENNGLVDNSYNMNDVSGEFFTGGVIGRNYGSAINVYNIANVSGDTVIGGVVGNNDGIYRGVGKRDDYLINAYNLGTVTGNSFVGGVAGFNVGEAVLQNCYNAGTIDSTGSSAGYVIGAISADTTENNNYYTVGNDTEFLGIGSVVSYMDSGVLLNSFYIENSEINNDDNKALFIEKTTMMSADFLKALNTWVDENQTNPSTYINWISEGLGLEYPVMSSKINIDLTNTSIQSQKVEVGSLVTFSALSIDNKVFTAWSGLDNVVFADGTNKNSPTVSFYAPSYFLTVSPVYVEFHDVTFNLNGGKIGTSEEDVVVKSDKNQNVIFPSDPVRDYYNFAGWYSQATGGVQMDSSSVITGETTIYAQWSKIPLIEQNLSFASDSLTKIVADSSFTNALSGAKTAVTYTSTNPDVATVDSMGKVTILSTGTTTITVTAEEDMVYKKATSSYALTVNEVPVTSLEELKDYVASFKGEFVNLSKIVFNGVELKITYSDDGKIAYLSGYPQGSTVVIGEAVEGSIVVTLYKEFLKTLPAGDYNLSVITRGVGQDIAAQAGTTVLTIPVSTVEPTVAPTANPDTPQTGDDKTAVFVFSGMMITAILAASFIIYKKRKMNS